MAARVVRVWKGYVTADGVQRCCGNHFANTVLPQLGALEGFLSAKVLVRSSDDETEVVVATVWDSIDSVKAFAGEDESEQNQGKGLTGELATRAMMARCLSLPRPPEPIVYQLRVVLRGVSLLIWRRLLIRSDSIIADLHAAFAWSDVHLHRFVSQGRVATPGARHDPVDG